MHGETVTIDRARMVGPTAAVPVSIGSRSPQVMRLAGELADVALVGGRIIDARIADEYRSWVEGADRVGRAVDEIEVAPRPPAFSTDGDRARRSLARDAAHYAASSDRPISSNATAEHG